jgi:hypothetical protein
LAQSGVCQNEKLLQKFSPRGAQAGVLRQPRDELLDDPHQFGSYLADRVIDAYGVEIANEQVDDAVAFVTPAILERVREMWLQDTPVLVAVEWGHECVNALLDRILQHPGYLLMGAALVAFEPAAAIWARTTAPGSEELRES